MSLATLSDRMTALILAALMAATVGTALGFQHLGGYIPCALCLTERQPYYAGIPLAILAALSASFNGPRWLTRSLIALCALLMIIGGGIGVYHSGVEWHFWPGPATCSTSVDGVTTNAANLLNDLNTVKGPSCTEAALRVLGLSFAGWNVVASALIGGFALAFLRNAKTR